MRDGDVIKARGRERQVERGSNVLSAHGGTELPGRDVAREVVKHGREIVPSLAGDLEVSEVRLPKLVDSCGLVLELVRRLDHHIGWAGDAIMRLQQLIDRRLREKMLPLVGEPYGQPSRRQFWKIQRQVEDLAADIVRDPAPDTIWS